MAEKKILKKAKELGKAIGESNVWKDFKKASEIFKKDKKIQKLLDALKEKENIEEEKLKKGLPVEPEEKHEIKKLEEELTVNKIFRDFITYENRYLQVLEKIDKSIKEGTEEAMKRE